MLLKQQLKDALSQVKKLKEENLELRQNVEAGPGKRKQLDKTEGTFVTSGSEDPNIICDNW